MTATNTQTAFLRRVRAALGRADRPAGVFGDLFQATVPEVRAARVAAIHRRSREDRIRLLDTLLLAAAPLKLAVTPVTDVAAAADAIVDLILGTEPEWGGRKSVVGWDHPLVASLGLQDRLLAHGIPFDLPTGDGADAPADRAGFRRQVEQAFVGVTAADFCVADTATLVMKTRPGEPRSVSLVPSVHVAVIHLDQIVADLTALYALIDPGTTGEEDGLGRCMTFISGPSKTADIELVMVHGAHGPRALHLFVITGR